MSAASRRGSGSLARVLTQRRGARGGVAQQGRVTHAGAAQLDDDAVALGVVTEAAHQLHVRRAEPPPRAGRRGPASAPRPAGRQVAIAAPAR